MASAAEPGQPTPELGMELEISLADLTLETRSRASSAHKLPGRAGASRAATPLREANRAFGVPAKAEPSRGKRDTAVLLEQMNKMESWAKSVEERSIKLSKANQQLRTKLDKTGRDCSAQQRKAVTLADGLRAAEGERDAAVEARRRLEDRVSRTDKGLALLKCTRLQQELDKAQAAARALQACAGENEKARVHLASQLALAKAALEKGGRPLAQAQERAADSDALLRSIAEKAEECEELKRQLKTVRTQVQLLQQAAGDAPGGSADAEGLRRRLAEAEADKSALLDYIQDAQSGRDAAAAPPGSGVDWQLAAVQEDLQRLTELYAQEGGQEPVAPALTVADQVQRLEAALERQRREGREARADAARARQQLAEAERRLGALALGGQAAAGSEGTRQTSQLLALAAEPLHTTIRLDVPQRQVQPAGVVSGELHAARAEAEQKLAAAASALAACQAQLASSQCEAAAAKQALAAAQSRLEELEAQLAALQQQQQAQAEAASGQAAEAAAALRGEAQQARQHVADVEAELLAAAQRSAALEAAVAAAQREREEVADLLQASHAEAKHLHRRLHALSEEQAADLQTGARLRAELDAAEGRVAELGAQLGAAERDLAAVGGDAAALRGALAAAAVAAQALLRGEPAAGPALDGIPDAQQLAGALIGLAEAWRQQQERLRAADESEDAFARLLEEARQAQAAAVQQATEAAAARAAEAELRAKMAEQRLVAQQAAGVEADEFAAELQRELRAQLAARRALEGELHGIRSAAGAVDAQLGEAQARCLQLGSVRDQAVDALAESAERRHIAEAAADRLQEELAAAHVVISQLRAYAPPTTRDAGTQPRQGGRYGADERAPELEAAQRERDSLRASLDAAQQRLQHLQGEAAAAVHALRERQQAELGTRDEQLRELRRRLRGLEAGPLGQSVPAFSPYERATERRLASRSLAAEDLRALQLGGEPRPGTSVRLDLEWGALPARGRQQRPSGDDGVGSQRRQQQQQAVDEGHLTQRAHASRSGRDWGSLVDEEDGRPRGASAASSRAASTTGDLGTPASRTQSLQQRLRKMQQSYAVSKQAQRTRA